MLFEFRAYVVVVLLFVDYENFYPKEKKEIPKGDEQKSQSKGWY